MDVVTTPSQPISESVENNDDACSRMNMSRIPYMIAPSNTPEAAPMSDELV